MSRLRGNAKWYGQGFLPVIPAESRILSMRTRSVRPLLVVNRILFIRAGWAYHTNKVEVLVPAYSLHYGPAQRYTRLLSTKREAVGNGFRRANTVPNAPYILVLLLKNN